jgi:hypothetical protein
MATITTTSALMWATPVDTRELCASLHAYHNTKAAANAVRICNILGSGSVNDPKPPVTKLHVELVEMVIQELYLEEKEIQVVRWEHMSDCYRGECDNQQGHQEPNWTVWTFEDELIPPEMRLELVREQILEKEEYTASMRHNGDEGDFQED